MSKITFFFNIQNVRTQLFYVNMLELSKPNKKVVYYFINKYNNFL